MAQLISSKRVQINKANTAMVAVVAVASFITVFSLVASNALWSQRSYQAKVIAEKEKAKSQLKANLEAVDSLESSFKSFIGTPTNVLGGNPNGTGEKDGDNAKIVLDALPSKYDFPAVVTSLEKILSDKSIKIDSITGIDDEVNQQTNSTSTEAVEIPFQIGTTGSYAAIQNLVSTLERSIRPFHISSVTFSGSDGELQTEISAKTYYLPEKSLNITTKDVK